MAQGKKTLVTGTVGFVGSHVCLAFTEDVH